MTDRNAGARTVPLDDVDVIDARGPDAVAFLHAQLSSDVRAIAPGDARFSAWLTPQGRTIAVLGVLRDAADGSALRLLVPRGRGTDILARLKRFVLRAKVELAPSPARCVGMPADERVPGALRLPDGRSVAVGALAPATAERRAWDLADVRAGVPWLESGAAELFVPQALGLARLGAYSVDKGCYPGQEIVARTHFLGRNKRRLVRYVRGSGEPLPAGARLLGDAGPEASAVVVSEVAGPDGYEGLAVVHEDALAGARDGVVLHPFDDPPPGRASAT